METPKVCAYYNFLADIAHQNHTLIAGATGSGKSVVINNFIASYVLQCKFPIGFAENRITAGLVLIDPKRVELVQYKNCMQTMAHATEPDEIIKAFSAVEKLMDGRYKKMERKHLKQWNGEDVYVIVDEFIEIASSKPVMESVKRIATLGRAANIHLIIATQRPSISDRLMPAVLRANMDCVVCLRTKEAKDSRMICGRDGAEKFPRPADIGKAHCFLCAPGAEDQHIMFGMTAQEDIDKIVKHWSPWYHGLYQRKLVA